MRFFPLWIILFTFCSYNLPQPFATAPAAVQTEPTAGEQAEARGAETPAAVEVLSTPTEVDRSYAEGMPLVARVNDQPVFLKDFEAQVARLTLALEAQGVDLAGADGQARLNQIRQQVFEALLNQAIIEQQAVFLGIQVEPGQVEARAQETIAQLGDQAQFERWLANNRLSYPEFLDSLRLELTTARLFEQVTGELETAEPALSEAELQERKREFFEEWLREQRSAAVIEQFVGL